MCRAFCKFIQYLCNPVFFCFFAPFSLFSIYFSPSIIRHLPCSFLYLTLAHGLPYFLLWVNQFQHIINVLPAEISFEFWPCQIRYAIKLLFLSTFCAMCENCDNRMHHKMFFNQLKTHIAHLGVSITTRSIPLKSFPYSPKLFSSLIWNIFFWKYVRSGSTGTTNEIVTPNK